MLDLFFKPAPPKDPNEPEEPMWQKGLRIILAVLILAGGILLSVQAFQWGALFGRDAPAPKLEQKAP